MQVDPRNDDSNPQQGTGTNSSTMIMDNKKSFDGLAEKSKGQDHLVGNLIRREKIPPTAKDSRKLFVGGTCVLRVPLSTSITTSFMLTSSSNMWTFFLLSNCWYVGLPTDGTFQNLRIPRKGLICCTCELTVAITMWCHSHGRRIPYVL